MKRQPWQSRGEADRFETAVVEAVECELIPRHRPIGREVVKRLPRSVRQVGDREATRWDLFEGLVDGRPGRRPQLASRATLGEIRHEGAHRWSIPTLEELFELGENRGVEAGSAAIVTGPTGRRSVRAVGSFEPFDRTLQRLLQVKYGH